MEDSGQNQIIFIAAGVILTLLVISVAFAIFRSGKAVTTSAQNDVDNLSTTLSDSRYTDLEGQTIKGIQVSGILNNFAGDQVVLTVITKSDTSVYGYTDDTFATKSDVLPSTTSNKKNANYINPNGDFEVTLERNANDVITGMKFEQK